ncbi:hypothetical protein ANO11243_051450 [Dothideomycetidae sp. 11243]|nr:hypothetical protein ANO11243_051450 [fungal sp. No.11243]
MVIQMTRRSPGFLDIAPELRVNVYAALFGSHELEPIELLRGRNESVDRIRRPTWLKHLWSLAKTNKTVYAEAMHYMWRNLEFEIYLPLLSWEWRTFGYQISSSSLSELHRYKMSRVARLYIYIEASAQQLDCLEMAMNNLDWAIYLEKLDVKIYDDDLQAGYGIDFIMEALPPIWALVKCRRRVSFHCIDTMAPVLEFLDGTWPCFRSQTRSQKRKATEYAPNQNTKTFVRCQERHVHQVHKRQKGKSVRRKKLGFLDFPPELRDMIYIETLNLNHNFPTELLRSPLERRTRLTSPLNIYRLAKTNKIIYNEAMYRMSTTLEFSIFLCSRRRGWLEEFQPQPLWLPCLYRYNLTAITRLDISLVSCTEQYIYLEMVLDAIKWARHVKELQISIGEDGFQPDQGVGVMLEELPRILARLRCREGILLGWFGKTYDPEAEKMLHGK